jgi:hypothetical protein
VMISRSSNTSIVLYQALFFLWFLQKVLSIFHKNLQ